MKVNEIDDISEADAVDDVADRTAQHQREARRERAGAERGMRQSQATMAMLTATARPMNSHRCQPEAVARKLNAAPTLCIRVMSRIGSTRVNSNSP